MQSLTLMLAIVDCADNDRTVALFKLAWVASTTAERFPSELVSVHPTDDGAAPRRGPLESSNHVSLMCGGVQNRKVANASFSPLGVLKDCQELRPV